MLRKTLQLFRCAMLLLATRRCPDRGNLSGTP